MARTFLILGGARSGKTRRALALAGKRPRKIYIATAEGRDEEMRARISLHRAERNGEWETVEAPLDVAQALRNIGDARAAAVVDCLTLWLTNMMLAGRDIGLETELLLAALARTPASVVLVSNEVGLGLVPETPLGRAFRDAQGCLNQAVAAAVDHVEFIAAGLPLRLKPSCDDR